MDSARTHLPSLSICAFIRVRNKIWGRRRSIYISRFAPPPPPPPREEMSENWKWTIEKSLVRTFVSCKKSVSSKSTMRTEMVLEGRHKQFILRYACSAASIQFVEKEKINCVLRWCRDETTVTTHRVDGFRLFFIFCLFTSRAPPMFGFTIRCRCVRNVNIHQN